jgi:hypothetical protein
MGNSNTLIASLIWGSIGMGFAIYGKRQTAMVPLFGGLSLVAISYFISSASTMSAVGTVIVGVMIWFKKRGY